MMLTFLSTNNYAQKSELDSLFSELKQSKDDTTKLNILIQIVENVDDENIWPKYNQQAFELANKLLLSNNTLIQKKAKKGLASSLCNSAIIFSNNGQLEKAMINLNKSLHLQEEIEDIEGIGVTLNNMGGIYESQGNIAKALDFYSRSLKIQQKTNNKLGTASLMGNLGYIYSNQGDSKLGLNYALESLKIREEIGDKFGIANSYNNIGSIYSLLHDTSLAIKYYIKALNIQKEIGFKQGVAGSLNNIALILKSYGDYNKALDYFEQSLKLSKEIGDKESTANTLNNIGSVYLRKKKYDIALSYADSSLILSKEIGVPLNIINAERLKFKLDSAIGNYKGAFLHYNQYILFRDSIQNQTTRKISIRNQLNYEFEKKEAILKEQQAKERAIANEQSRIQKIVIACVLIGFLLVVVFAFFIFRTLKITRNQKHIIEEKQKEILDSIRYAKRIQTSLLPTEKYIAKKLNPKH
ncbi:MAG: tetratricopeptide repeat protein [Bacteroidota bacterium]|nr:tetratricopeptide repeat protein [Bacteroidota bacterium]